MHCKQEEADKKRRESYEAQINKWQQDIEYLGRLCRKMLLCLGMKASFVTAQRRLRKLVNADFACLYRVVTDPLDSERHTPSKLLQYVPISLFTEDADEASTYSDSAHCEWSFLEFSESLAGAVASKGLTMTMARGAVELLPEGGSRTKQSKRVKGAWTAEYWEKDVLQRFTNAAGPLKGRRQGSMICAPVLDSHGRVKGVVQVSRFLEFSQDKGHRGLPKPFSARAKHLIAVFCSLLSGHLGASCSNLVLRSDVMDYPRTLSLPTQVVDTVPRLMTSATSTLRDVAANLSALANFHCNADEVLLHMLDTRNMTLLCLHRGDVYTTNTSVGVAWRAATEDKVINLSYSTLLNVDDSLYTHLSLTPAHIQCCALRQANGRLFGILELIRSDLQPSSILPAEMIQDERQLFRLCTACAPAVEGAWNAHQLAAASEQERRTLNFSLSLSRILHRNAKHFITSLGSEIEKRLHCMLCQVYAISKDELWTVLGHERMAFARQNAKIVTTMLDKTQSMSAVAQNKGNARAGHEVLAVGQDSKDHKYSFCLSLSVSLPLSPSVRMLQ